MTEKILYQHGTLGALMAGLMDGTETIAHILEKGTLGLGTLHGLDGEVIFLDGVAYQGRSDGSVAQLDGSELTPYAAITDFTPDTSFSVSKTADGEQLKKDILVREAGENLFFGSEDNWIIQKYAHPYHAEARKTLQKTSKNFRVSTRIPTKQCPRNISRVLYA